MSFLWLKLTLFVRTDLRMQGLVLDLFFSHPCVISFQNEEITRVSELSSLQSLGPWIWRMFSPVPIFLVCVLGKVIVTSLNCYLTAWEVGAENTSLCGVV